MQQQPGGNGLPAGLGAGGSSGGPAYPPGAAAYVQQFYAQQALADDLTKFWKRMAQEVDEHSDALADFKSQALPLARIKKIMKSDEDVRMISAEAPVLFARACEFFIQELTMRSWAAAQESKRRTMQRSDVATAISRTDIFDFLVDIVPREEANDPPGADGSASGHLMGLPQPLPAAAAPMAQLGGMAAPQMGLYPPQQQEQQQQQQQQQMQQGQQQMAYLQPMQQGGGQQYLAPPMGMQQQQAGGGPGGGGQQGAPQQGGMPPPGMMGYNPYLQPYGAFPSPFQPPPQQ